ncbi:MAG: hypothetical protein WCF84_02695 [Anaerolineae bacterium]
MKLIKLNCPACAGTLELPDNLTVAHCIYCGNKILLDQDGLIQERRDIERYIELCKVAVEAKNHNEVIRYCNLILEIDPKNIDAWINKAVSTFWLTTGANNRYDEAIEYLNKAAQLAPDGDDRVNAAKKELTLSQALWYNHLGTESWNSALRSYNIFYNSRLYVHPDEAAQERSQESAIKAVNYYLKASNFAPDHITILKNIETVVEKYFIVKWNQIVLDKLDVLDMLRAKKEAEEKLPGLRAELQNAIAECERLKTQKGIFIGAKIKEAERRRKQLESAIAQMEQAAAYIPPKR